MIDTGCGSNKAQALQLTRSAVQLSARCSGIAKDEHAAVEFERPLKVGDLEVHMPDADLWVHRVRGIVAGFFGCHPRSTLELLYGGEAMNDLFLPGHFN
jgi:hypothetical protein